MGNFLTTIIGYNTLSFDDIKDKDKYKGMFKWMNYLGGDSFGKVYEVEYNGIKYAGKKIQKNMLTNENKKKALEREIEILNIMNNCENSVKFYSHFDEQENEILILELCDYNLEEIINKSYNGLEANQIYLIMDQLNNAFLRMYQNDLIHRDIKPKNIMFKYQENENSNENYLKQIFADYPYINGEPRFYEIKEFSINHIKRDYNSEYIGKLIPKLSNYGLSTQIQDFNTTGYVTSIYTAPEIFLNKNYSSKSDLWSIGIMIYYMSLKELPFDIPDFNDLNDIEKKLNSKKKKDINDINLDDLVNKLLVYDPDKRIGWQEYFNHPFFTNKLHKRFSGNQYIEITFELYNDSYKYYLINDGNESGFVMENPISYDELNEKNTDMYIDGIQTKFRKIIYNENGNNSDVVKITKVKYVFDHKLKRLDYMFFSCTTVESVKFFNVDISLVNNMKYMFSGCDSLKFVDLNCYNTHNLTNIYNCFFGICCLEEVNLSNFDFKNIREAGLIFGRTPVKKVLISKKQDKNLIEKIFGNPNYTPYITYI